MKLGQFKFHMAPHGFSSRVPLRIKFTFFIGIGALISMIILAVICIQRSVSYTEKLMHARLTQFASMKSQQIQRDMNNHAVGLNGVFQGDTFYILMDKLYEGNITTDSWATGIEGLFTGMFATQMRSYQISTSYDNSGNFLFSMPNPRISSSVIHKLEPNLPTLLPLGTVLEGRNQTRIYQNSTAVINQAAAAAAEASWSKGTLSQIPSTENHTGPLNFTSTPDKVWSWMSEPVPLRGPDGKVDAYSFSLTIPITHHTVNGDIQTSRLLGYTTCVLDCSQYMNRTNIMAFDQLSVSKSPTHASFSISEANQQSGWRFVFPTEVVSTFPKNWAPFTEFPAAEAALYLEEHSSKNKGPPTFGGAIMSTKTPDIKKASVGFSFVKVINRNWIITITIPKSAMQAGYHKLSKTLVGISIGDSIFVVSCAFFLTGLTTSPLNHIYRGMQLEIDTHSIHSKINNDNTGNHKIISKPSSTWIQRSAHSCYRLFVQPFHALWYRQGDNQDVEEMRSFSCQKTDSSRSMSQKSRSDTLVESVNSDNNSLNSTSVGTACNMPIDKETNTTVSVNPCSHLRENSCGSNLTTDTSTDVKEDAEEVFKVPKPIPPLNRRWIVDEFDELITEYNEMVVRLNLYGAKMNDEVKSRTKEAKESQILAEAANKAKTIFLMKITNELRTPLNGILGIAAVAYYEKDISLIKLRRYLQTIIDSGEILQELLQHLSNYSSQLADDEFTYKEFSLFSLVQIISAGHFGHAEDKKIAFKVAVMPEQSDRTIIGTDLGKVNIICTNVVSNALKFTDPRKKVFSDSNSEAARISVTIQSRRPTRIMHTNQGSPTFKTELGAIKSKRSVPMASSANKTSTVEDDISARGNHSAILEITITDNGIGIDQDRSIHIFEAFVQGDETSSNPYAGAGVGLAMSKMECERLGGEICVHSKPQVGTMVILRIPVACVDEQHTKSTPSLQPQKSLQRMNDELSGDRDSNPDVATVKRDYPEPISKQHSLNTVNADGSTYLENTNAQCDFTELKNYANHILKLRDAPMISTRNMQRPAFVNADSLAKTRQAAKGSTDLALKTFSMLSNLATLNTFNSTAFDNKDSIPQAESLYSKIESVSSSVEMSKIPLQKQEITPLSALTSSCDADWPHLRILVADDNDTIRMIMKQFSNKLGVQDIDIVKDGPSVIEKIERAIVGGTKYSIIFMDLSMPGRDGIEATKAIQRQLGYYCPVVALTGHSDESTTRLCLEAGIQKVLIKPVTIQSLAETICELTTK